MIYSKTNEYTLYEGKMQDVLENEIEKESIDCIITDPPYELNFMNKGWDNTGVAFQKDTWKKCFDVLKWGGFLLAFGGSRTFHRIACAIEDAGFEIKDCIMWLYGSGFPKSNDVGLKIDKRNNVDNKTGNIITTGTNNADCIVHVVSGNSKIYEERKATNEWGGWGHSLKPAYEPIIVARKPVKDTLIDNVLNYRVGAYNIDECRIYTNDNLARKNKEDNGMFKIGNNNNTAQKLKEMGIEYAGRFPANVITDGSEEVAKGMPNTKSNYNENSRHETKINRQNADTLKYGYKTRIVSSSYNDEGSAMRYFYCAKASTKDRDEGLEEFELKYRTDNYKKTNFETSHKFGSSSSPTRNTHVTVKPTELMQYLVRLVAPKGATILDCFMGSGSAGKAVMFENRERNKDYKFIGVEMTKEYLSLAKARIDYALNKYEYDEIMEKQENKKKGINTIFDFMENE